MAPYDVRGTDLYSKSGGKWHLKSHHATAQAAHVVKAELEALESGRIQKFGDRMRARKK